MAGFFSWFYKMFPILLGRFLNFFWLPKYSSCGFSSRWKYYWFCWLRQKKVTLEETKNTNEGTKNEIQTHMNCEKDLSVKLKSQREENAQLLSKSNELRNAGLELQHTFDRKVQNRTMEEANMKHKKESTKIQCEQEKKSIEQFKMQNEKRSHLQKLTHQKLQGVSSFHLLCLSYLNWGRTKRKRYQMHFNAKQILKISILMRCARRGQFADWSEYEAFRRNWCIFERNCISEGNNRTFLIKNHFVLGFVKLFQWKEWLWNLDTNCGTCSIMKCFLGGWWNFLRHSAGFYDRTSRT